MLISQIKKELKILHQFAQKISSSLELNDVLNHIVEIAIDLTKGDSCLIYLYNRKSEELVLRTSKNPHPRILGRIKLKIGEGITGLVAKQKNL
jgi:uroporphyrinogen-III synthase